MNGNTLEGHHAQIDNVTRLARENGRRVRFGANAFIIARETEREARTAGGAPSGCRLSSCGSKAARVAGWNDAICPHPIRRPPVSGRDHQPRRVAVPSLPLGLRMVEELLSARGIIVSHETVWQWVRKFGQEFANQIRRRLPIAGDKWHVDEVVLKIAGVTHWLWRAVDQTGVVLDVLGPEPARQAGRETPAAQASEASRPSASRDDHRQAGELQRCQTRGDARGRASAAQGTEQQGGELASDDAPARTTDEAVQVTRPSAAVPVSSRCDQQFYSIFAAITSPPTSIDKPGCARSRSGLRSVVAPPCRRDVKGLSDQTSRCYISRQQLDGAVQPPNSSPVVAAT